MARSPESRLRVCDNCNKESVCKFKDDYLALNNEVIELIKDRLSEVVITIGKDCLIPCNKFSQLKTSF